MKIRMNGMEFFIMLKNEGRKIIKIGVNISIIGKAASEPYKVRIKASWAFPSKSILWPGRIDRKLSSSGAPR